MERCTNAWTVRIDLFKTTVLPMQSTGSVQSQPNYQWHLSRNYSPEFKKLLWKQKTSNTQSNLEKENGAGGLRFLKFRTYYKAAISKTAWYWHKTKYISVQQDRKSRDKPIHLGQLIYDKGDKKRQQRKDSLFDRQCLENQTTCKNK